MLLTIKNSDAVDNFMQEHMDLDHTLFSEKGPAPAGATLDDGTPITWEVNTAWVCHDCGARINVEYETAGQ